MKGKRHTTQRERQRWGEQLLCLLTIRLHLHGTGAMAQEVRFLAPVPTRRDCWTVGGGIFIFDLWQNFGMLGLERRFRISRRRFEAHIR